MDWADTHEQAAFRGDVRRFIAERFPPGYRPDREGEQSLEPEDVPGYHWDADRRSPDTERRAAVAAWTAALAERGWIAPHWPQEYGGAGLGLLDQFIFSEEMARARVPAAGGIGVTMLGPTLIAHGSAAQQREHLPRILRGEVAWAQGFSEPAAGSDLAALNTRAVRDGGQYVVSGQKIWTSAAQYADWMCALVRTNPEAPRHRGISFLLFDTTSPGVTIRPLTDLAWGHPFNEVFFDEVRVPATNLVGEQDRGWYVAMAMLDFERSGIGYVVGHRNAIDDLLGALRGALRGGRGDGNDGSGDDDAARVRPDRRALRGAVADRCTEIEVAHAFALRTVSMQAAGLSPSHEASVNQLFRSELHQRLAATGLRVFGLYGNLWQRSGAPVGAWFTRESARAVSATLLSGTSEVQRNVIATRGLGLPRS